MTHAAAERCVYVHSTNVCGCLQIFFSCDWTQFLLRITIQHNANDYSNLQILIISRTQKFPLFAITTLSVLSATVMMESLTGNVISRSMFSAYTAITNFLDYHTRNTQLNPTHRKCQTLLVSITDTP